MYNSKPKMFVSQDRPAVTPYATGLCSAPPTSAQHTTADLPPKHPHGRAERHGRDDAASAGSSRPHAVTVSSSSSQEYGRLHHQQYHQPQHQQTVHVSTAHKDRAAVNKTGADWNQHRVPSASASPAPCKPAATPALPEDYPIRGTMSPLTCQVGGGRGEGGGGEAGSGGRHGEGGDALSFVFGRPATSDAAVMGRCASPPASLPSGKRPLSPSTRDVLPIRRSASGGGSTVVEREVLSTTPPASSLGWGEGGVVQGGVCCEQCNGCLIDLKRQALRLMFPDTGNGACLAQVRRVSRANRLNSWIGSLCTC